MAKLSATTRRLLWAVIGVSTLLRLIWAASVGATYDEPYYFQYVAHPAWAYFDHPPMVAFVAEAGLAVVGNALSVPGLRLGFIALFAGLEPPTCSRLTTRAFSAPGAGVLAAPCPTPPATWAMLSVTTRSRMGRSCSSGC